jgi:hypothetical protein
VIGENLLNPVFDEMDPHLSYPLDEATAFFLISNTEPEVKAFI